MYAGGRNYHAIAPKVMLIHAWDEFLTLHGLTLRVEKTCKTFKADLLLIENKSSGISVSQELHRLFTNKDFGVQMFDPKSQDKTARLISVQHLFEEGIIYAPSEKYPWVEKVISQVGQFPKGKHDEFVDLISMGLRYLRANGLISRSVEREAEVESSKLFRSQHENAPLYPT
jgi:predicted phage terminase large subunit-like protein